MLGSVSLLANCALVSLTRLYFCCVCIYVVLPILRLTHVCANEITAPIAFNACYCCWPVSLLLTNYWLMKSMNLCC